MREQSWWLLCVSEAKQGSKQSASAKCNCAQRSGDSFGFSHAARSRSPARVCAVCTSLYGTSRFGGFPPPTLRVVRVEAGRRRGGDRSAVIHNSARGCRFRFSFLSVPPGRSGGRPRRRAGGVEDEVTTAYQNHEPSRAPAPRGRRAVFSIARTLNVRVWPHTGYACISYRYLSSVHGRLSHDGPSHF